MNTSWAETYAALAHTRDFVPTDAREALASVRENLASAEKQQGRYLLSDEDALRFALSFLTLLDLGCTPVCISADASPAWRERLREEMPQAGVVQNGKLLTHAERGGGERAYVCRDHVCSAPVTDRESLRRVLATTYPNG